MVIPSLTHGVIQRERQIKRPKLRGPKVNLHTYQAFHRVCFPTSSLPICEDGSIVSCKNIRNNRFGWFCVYYLLICCWFEYTIKCVWFATMNQRFVGRKLDSQWSTTFDLSSRMRPESTYNFDVAFAWIVDHLGRRFQFSKKLQWGQFLIIKIHQFRRGHQRCPPTLGNSCEHDIFHDCSIKSLHHYMVPNSILKTIFNVIS